MKTIPLSAVLILGLTAAAGAADLPSRYNPSILSPAPVSTWTGFYVGAQLGYAWGGDQTVIKAAGFPFTFVAPDHDTSGFVGGVHAGFNYQAGAAVFGLEGDLELAGIDGKVGLAGSGSFPGYSITSSTEIDFQGSLRARAGLAFDRVMVYGTGGLAFASVKNNYGAILPAGNVFGVPRGIYGSSADEIRWGWTLGAGIEYAISNNLMARVEYRYTNFNKFDNQPSFLAAGVAEQEPDFHTLRIGASYKF
jgi:outer membrane immunogenic protein